MIQYKYNTMQHNHLHTYISISIYICMYVYVGYYALVSLEDYRNEGS